MAKITALAIADQLTGDEHLPIVQGLATKRVTMRAFRDLITPFLQQADFELGLFLAELRGQPSLVIGFGGAAPETLAAIIDPESAAEHQISFDYAGWVDELIAGDARVQKLSAYLEQGQLSLRSVQALFHETFD